MQAHAEGGVLEGKTCVLPLLAVRLVPRTYLYLVIVQLHLLSRAMQHLHASSIPDTPTLHTLRYTSITPSLQPSSAC